MQVSVDAMKLLARLTCKYSQCENLWRTVGAGRPATGNNSPTGLAGLRGWAGFHWLTDKPSDREETDRQRERDRERQRERERDRERERETERDREIQRDTDRDRERQRKRQRETERDRERQRETERDSERQ